MSDPIWIDNFKILFKYERLMEFFPVKEQTHEERINAIVRLSLYVSILLVVYHSKAKYFGICVFFLAFSFVVYRHRPVFNTSIDIQPDMTLQQKLAYNLKTEQSKPTLNNFTPYINIEKLENTTKNKDISECTKPTIANPFGNFTMADMMTLDDNGNIVDKQPACDPNNPEIKELIDESFNNNLYKDVSDVFGKTNSQRNYFSMPWTTIVNDQDSFARWLYLSPKTCKEDQDNCLRYEDIRSKRFVMPNADRNPISSKKDTLIQKV